MKNKHIPLFSILLAAGFSQSTNATPISASMNLTASADFDGINQTTNNADAWGILLAPLNVSATAAVNVAGTPFGASVGGSGAATWGAGGNTGSVVFSNYGWNIDTDSSAWSVGLNDHTNGDDWTYTFEADKDAVFTLRYFIESTGFTSGLNGWEILWNGAGGGLDLTNTFNPDAAGVFERGVVAGEIYTVALRNHARLTGEDDGETVGSMNAQFAFTIPEPASLALLGIGLAGLGFMRRRRLN